MRAQRAGKAQMSPKDVQVTIVVLSHRGQGVSTQVDGERLMTTESVAL